MGTEIVFQSSSLCKLSAVFLSWREEKHKIYFVKLNMHNNLLATKALTSILFIGTLAF